MPPLVKYSKEIIIKVGLELIEEEGIESVSARNIAKRLGSSICPVFSYFESMDVLKGELMKKIYQVYIDYLSVGIENNEKKFKGAGLAYIKFAKEKPNYFKALFMFKNGKSITELLKIDKSNEDILNIICENTGLNKDNALKLHEYNWVFVHGIATMMATGYCNFDDNQISEMLTTEYLSLLDSFREG